MRLRKEAPVFVIGSPRSGTTLFYHMLLSTGDFAVYRTEAHVFNMLVPKFGDLRARKNRQSLLKEWLPSEYCRRSGLPPAEIAAEILAGCRSGGDFLRILMESIARRQGVPRWAECTPENVLYLRQIKREIPDALFIHMIRDGRDVALSMERQGWIHPLPGDAKHSLLVAGLYWDWLIHRGRAAGRQFAGDYLEVRYEDLVERPQETLSRIAPFLEQELDHQKIQAAGIGSVSEPNTSFRQDGKADFNPVGRWKTALSAAQIARIEGLLASTLSDFGYALSLPAEKRHPDAALLRMRAMYRLNFSLRHWMKTRTPLARRLVSTDLLRDFHSKDQDHLRPDLAAKQERR